MPLQGGFPLNGFEKQLLSTTTAAHSQSQPWTSARKEQGPSSRTDPMRMAFSPLSLSLEVMDSRQRSKDQHPGEPEAKIVLQWRQLQKEPDSQLVNEIPVMTPEPKKKKKRGKNNCELLISLEPNIQKKGYLFFQTLILS